MKVDTLYPVVVAIASGLAACSLSGGTDSLADGQGLARVRYRLGHVEVDFGRGPPSCIELGSDLRGTANGHPMTIEDHGHHLYKKPSTGYDGNPNPGFDLCIPPTFGAPNLDGGRSFDIVIEDDSARIHARFDDLFTQRAIVRIGPAMVSAGDTIDLAWSPASDRLPAKLDFAWSDPTGARPLEGAENTIVDGHITVLAPEVAMPTSLALDVYNWSSAVSAGAAICEGAAGCDAQLANDGGLSLSYQIEP